MKKLVVLAVALIIASGGYWYYSQQVPKVMPEQDLMMAMKRAYAEKKLLFILYGRQGCSNCQSLRSYIDSGAVQIDQSRFVYADVSCDDAATKEEFRYRFDSTSTMLPIVVIADSNSRLLLSRSGYGGPDDFKQFIQSALQKT